MNKQAKIIMFTCLYIIGIIAFNSSMSFGFFFLTTITLSFLFFKKKLFPLKMFITFMIIFLVGIINSSIHTKYFDDLSSFIDEDVNLIAKVVTIPTNNIENRTKFYAQVSSVQTKEEETQRIKAKTLITINDSNEKIKKIKIGDLIQISGRLKAPAIAQNPSQFDYAKYLQYKNTYTLLYVTEDWKTIGTDTAYIWRILRKLNDTRNKILNIHAQNVESPMLEILGGIIFGDDAVNPDEETKESFINSGIFHILAASGMNVTLIFGIWFFFAKSLRLNYRFSITTGILLILFYTCMTGFGPPIIRATLMLTLILIGKLIDKETSTISLLFLVAFLMLFINPLMLYDIGFQLSFIVTFALIMTAPLLTFNFKIKAFNYIAGACLIPVIAQLFAAPLQMFYFNTFTIYSVFANIAIIPILSIVSFIGFISSIIALIPTIATRVCYIADMILNPFLVYIVKVAQFFSELPFSIIYLRKPTIIQIILYFSCIIALIIILKMKDKNKKFYIAFATLFLFFILSLVRITSNNLEIIYFSVGNADATLIKAPNNEYFLIDTGKTSYLNGTTQAKNIIIKYLQDKGIKNINSLILTHYDSDHAGGTIDILGNLNVENVYVTNIAEDTQLTENITKFMQENDIKATTTENILEIFNKNNFKITIIQPIGNKIISENQKSLIIHCKNNNKNILFMGDGDIHSYNSLPNEYKQNISILRVGHHGAKDTLNKEMIDGAEYFIISTGKNIYNHPHYETINLLEENLKQYLRTDKHNAIKTIISNKEIKNLIYSPKTKRFIPYKPSLQ